MPLVAERENVIMVFFLFYLMLSLKIDICEKDFLGILYIFEPLALHGIVLEKNFRSKKGSTL